MPTSESQALLTPALTDDEVLRIRNDFPILSRSMGGHPLIYLDSGATSQNPLSVIEAEQEFYEQRNAAVHRGAHLLAVEATESFEDARETLAAFLGAGADEIIWTSNATEGLNLLSYAFLNSSLPGAAAEAAQFALGAGDEIVVTEMEHHANLIPWQQLAERTGATLRFIPVDDAGVLDLDAAAGIINPATRVLAFSHASNVLGTINPVKTLVAMAREAG
ncbi:aminotransferase class V-fold PLP-dependent enzyme, partial [Arthrobacter sp. TB 26]|uniref:aminotransferase class V-fold PLP-dependent enzyme n=1 Tax=Arthrobacter sp. TB 26 TaxID=494420 RepID=UPI0005501405